MKLTQFEWIQSELKHVIYEFSKIWEFFYYFLNRMYCRYYFLSSRGLIRKNLGLSVIFLRHQWTTGLFPISAGALL
jgi:hypothetical protein